MNKTKPITLKPSVVSVRTPFWKRIPLFFHILVIDRFPIRQAWIASRAERLPVWKMEIEQIS